jgi:RHS repeat-associated protein
MKVDIHGNRLDYRWEPYIEAVSERYFYEPMLHPDPIVRKNDYLSPCSSLRFTQGYAAVDECWNALPSNIMSVDATWNLRLRQVSSPDWNWNIYFSYPNDQLVDAGLGSGLMINLGTLQQGTARPIAVSSSNGDHIELESTVIEEQFGLPSKTRFEVRRAPTGLDASYEVKLGQFYAEPFMTKLNDPLGAPGGRKLDFEVGLHLYFEGVKKVFNGRGQLAFQLEAPFSGIGNYTSVLRAADGSKISEDLYRLTPLGPELIQRTLYSDGPAVTEQYEYNTDYLITAITNGRGHRTEFEYDALGNRVRRTFQQAGQTINELATYDSMSRLLTYVDGRGTVTKFEYSADQRENLVKVIEDFGGLNRETVFTYDSQGLLETVRKPDNQVYSVTHDANGNIASVVEPAITLDGVGPVPGMVIQYLVDDRGRLNRFELRGRDGATYVTEIEWNALDRMSKVTLPGGRVRQFEEYDQHGNLESMLDEAFVRTRQVWDADDNPTDVMTAYGTAESRHIQMEYDARSNRTAVVDGDIKRTQFDYNLQDLVTRIIDPTSKAQVFTYDAAFNLATRSDGRPVTVAYEYYENDLLKRFSFSDGTDPVEFEYDAAGNRTRMLDSLKDTQYSFNRLRQLTAVSSHPPNSGPFTSGPFHSLSYFYDNRGRRERVNLSANLSAVQELVYEYYENGLPKAVTDRDGDRTIYSYSSLNQIESIVLPDGIARSTRGFGVDGIVLAGITNSNVRGETLSSFTYQRDALFNVTRIDSLAQSEEFGYDLHSQLVSIDRTGAGFDEIFQYDKRGNRTVQTRGGLSVQSASFGDANEILNLSALHSFSHDDAGNIVLGSGPGSSSSYTWDALNRLKQVSGAGGGSSVLAQYRYDGDNLRVRKTTGAGVVTNYLYDGLQLLAETDGVGAVKKLYNPGVSVTDDKGNKFYYLHDGRGNVANLIDRDGNIVDVYTYEAFGMAVGVSKNSNEFLHDGLDSVMTDMDVQLEYMWNRWYDPQLGRFISRDPIGFAGGLNLYGYVGNNPLTFTDPYGLRKSYSEWTDYFGWVDPLASFSAGFGDTIMPFGITEYLRAGIGVQGVNTSSSAYTRGRYTGYGYNAVAIALSAARIGSEVAIANTGNAVGKFLSQGRYIRMGRSGVHGPTLRLGSLHIDLRAWGF